MSSWSPRVCNTQRERKSDLFSSPRYSGKWQSSLSTNDEERTCLRKLRCSPSALLKTSPQPHCNFKRFELEAWALGTPCREEPVCFLQGLNIAGHLMSDQYQDMKAHFRTLLERKYRAKKSRANKHDQHSRVLRIQVRRTDFRKPV